MAVRYDPGYYTAPSQRKPRKPPPQPDYSSVTSIAPPPSAPAAAVAPAVAATVAPVAAAVAAPQRRPPPIPVTTTLASTMAPTAAPTLPQQLLQAKALATADNPDDLATQIEAARTAATPQRRLDRLDRRFAPGETISPKNAALLAESQGLPGQTYAQIARGESSLHPNVVGYDEGGTHGLGLWQMTPGVQSPETRQRWAGIAAEHEGGYMNPVANAEMASVLAGGGTGVSNYYGSDYVTDPDAHLTGGETLANRLLRMRGY